MTAYTLTHLIQTETLQELQERFAAATGFAVIIADQQGEPVTVPSNFTGFCTKMRLSEKGARCCVLSDRKIGLEAAGQGKPAIHYCHAGLIDFAAPIVLDGVHIGSVLCGQVLMEDHDEEQLAYIKKRLQQLPLDSDLLEQYFGEFQRISQQRIDATLQTLQLAADFIVETGTKRLMTAALLERDSRLPDKQENEQQLENLLREAQRKIGEPQLNARFLLNALNTISRVAYLEEAEQTQDVTVALAKIIRYSLRDANETVTVKEALAYIHSHLTIQQARLRKPIAVEERIELDMESMRVPLISLQPFFESAANLKGGDMRISIRGYLQEGEAVLEISGQGVERTTAQLTVPVQEVDAHESADR